MAVEEEHMVDARIWTVSEISSYIQAILEDDPELSWVQVRGEIANFHHHRPSGHFYFNLSENDYSLQCVLFNGVALELPFKLENGIEIVAEGRITTYSTRSQYQIRVSEVRPSGLGTLYQAFENIKSRLDKEGLFDERHKKPLPRYPGTIGLVTSPVGAARRDVEENLRKRYPVATLLISPAVVQGAGAAKSLVSALKQLTRRPEVDVIILARGGGSFEELFVFNDETLARTIFDSGIPVVTGIGHQKDFTIADFVADVRAGTPSHAVEVCTPDQAELAAYVKSLQSRLGQGSGQLVKDKGHRLQVAANSRFFHRAESFMARKQQRIDELARRLVYQLPNQLNRRKERFEAAARHLSSVDPLSVLSRGFSVSFLADSRAVIKSLGDVAIQDEIVTRVRDGEILSKVKGKEEVKDEPRES
jgi:exodeoxyribonuclease VII large subunit